MKFIKSVGENTIIHLKDKLDYATASVLMDELRTLVGKGVKKINFYCSELEYISSAGIRAMVFVKQKIDKNVDVDVYLHNAAESIKEVFEMSGLDGYFEFVD